MLSRCHAQDKQDKDVELHIQQENAVLILPACRIIHGGIPVISPAEACL